MIKVLRKYTQTGTIEVVWSGLLLTKAMDLASVYDKLGGREVDYWWEFETDWDKEMREFLIINNGL